MWSRHLQGTRGSSSWQVESQIHDKVGSKEHSNLPPHSRHRSRNRRSTRGKAGGWVLCGVWNCRAVVPISAPGFRTTSEAPEPLIRRQKADTLLARRTLVISCHLPNPSSQHPPPETLFTEKPRAGEDPGTQTRPPCASHTTCNTGPRRPHLQAKAAFESCASGLWPSV